MNNHILKPSLPPPTYKIKSQLLHTAFKVTPASHPKVSLVSLSPGFTSGALVELLKNKNGQAPSATGGVGQSVCVLELLQMILKQSQHGDHLFCLRFSKLAPFFLTSVPLNKLLIQSRICFLLENASY